MSIPIDLKVVGCNFKKRNTIIFSRRYCTVKTTASYLSQISIANTCSLCPCTKSSGNNISPKTIPPCVHTPWIVHMRANFRVLVWNAAPGNFFLHIYSVYLYSIFSMTIYFVLTIYPSRWPLYNCCVLWVGNIFLSSFIGNLGTMMHQCLMLFTLTCIVSAFALNLFVKFSYCPDCFRPAFTEYHFCANLYEFWTFNKAKPACCFVTSS